MTNTTLKKTTAAAVLLCATAIGAAPMIDTAHDRVQTTLDPGMKRIGTLVPRSAREVGPSSIAVGCEMLPRGYGDFEAFKEYMPPLGVARVRLHAGWAKLEPKPGVWDFAWLDRQVDWLIAHGMEPLLETSYGNPIYPGAGGPSLSDGMPRGDVALAAWDRYVEKLATHYPQIKNWACWNEPNNTKSNTAAIIADNNIRTARIIRRHIPDAKIGMLVLGWPDPPQKLTTGILEIMKAENAFGLFHWAIYHDYSPNPDTCYGNVESWARLIHRYAPHLRIWNGESGATSQSHYSAPISSGTWNSELTQAKWDARRLVGDLGHGYESLVFTMYDACYDNPERYCNKVPAYWVRTRPNRFMKWMGLVKCNDRLQVTKVKPAYYTVQNIATLFDATVVPAKLDIQYLGDTVRSAIGFYTFRQKGSDAPLLALWNASEIPSNENRVQTMRIRTAAGLFKDPVWIDLVTGAIYEVPAAFRTVERNGRELWRIPAYDAPAVLTEKTVTGQAVGGGLQDAAARARGIAPARDAP